MIPLEYNRWVFASVTKHFFDAASAANVEAIIEGQVAQATASDYYEIRVNGPKLTQTSHSDWLVEAPVNIFISSQVNESNFHRIHDLCGIIVAACTTISVYRYGPITEDGPNDQSLVGCLYVDGQIRTDHFGQLAANRPVMRAAVTAFYRGWLLDQ